MRADTLLAIDAHAELRNLCEARLQGSWQVPAELVRLAVARGATEVAVIFTRRAFSVSATGAALSRDLLSHWAGAVAPGNGREQQHRAILELEAAGADSLLFISALDRARVTASSSDGEQQWELRLPSGRLDALSNRARHREMSIEVKDASMDSSRAARWLREACRFAPVKVLVDGEACASGFRHGLFRITLQQPLPCQLAVTRRGEAPRLFLLQHGLITTQATVPGYPAFEAAVEMSQAVQSGAPPPRLREVVTPHLAQLIDQAVAMLINLAPRLPELDPEARRRITGLLLRSARQGLRRPQIFQLPLLEVRDHHGDRTWLRVGEVVDRARGEGGTITVLSPEQEPERFAIGGSPVLVLSADERSELARISDLRLVTPPSIKPLLSAAVRLRRHLAELRITAGEMLSRLTGGGRGRIIDEHRLNHNERDFLTLLAESGVQWRDGRPLRWALTTGRGRVQRGGAARGTILLPRSEPLVRRSIRILSSDARWTYPVLAALNLPAGLSLTEARFRWSQIVDRGP